MICPDSTGVFSPAQDLDLDFPFWTQMNADYQDFKHKEQTIIKVFYRVYNKLGYGFLEKIYENAMMIEFRIEVGLLLNFVTKPEFKRKGI